MLLVLVVVIAVASGLASLNFLLIAAFCLLRQRRKDTRDLENELGSLEDRLSPVKRLRSNPKIQRHYSRKENGIETKWPTTPLTAYKPTNTMHLDVTNPLKTSLLKPPPSLSRPNDYLTVPANFGVSRATTRTDHSEKTVSIYSSESAPPHFHDQLSNPPSIVMSNITRSNLPRGMNLPSTVTRDIGLFIHPLPLSGTANLPSSSDSMRLRANTSAGIPNYSGIVKPSYSHTTPIPQSARLEMLELHQSQLLYRGVNLQTLKKTASTSSFPPPLW